MIAADPAAINETPYYYQQTQHNHHLHTPGHTHTPLPLYITKSPYFTGAQARGGTCRVREGCPVL